MKPAIHRCRLLLFALILLLLPIATPFAAAPTLQALILSGGDNRDWRASTTFLRELLEDSGRFEVRINEAPEGLTSKSLTGFDLVVVDSSKQIPVKALREFAENGEGIVVTLPAIAATASHLGLIQRSPQAPTNTAFHRFELNPANPEHPVMHGLKNLKTADRPLQSLSLATGAEALATADQTPILFASRIGKGRVFGTTLGSGVGSMQESAFITTFLRGAEWAASGSVTLPTEISMPSPSTNGVRVLVITGGHDHEAAFYGLFNGYKDIGWIPVSDSKLAFQQDIRGKYDVLVFYDFTRDMDDKSKQNLRDFVESGKGIVVLHHGILNFQKWPWWYEEVVGGLYRLERQGSIPNSTVKFGQQHFIKPAGKHPITAGIDPFEVTDETYKGLFISDKVTPLLVTDNPTSDPTVAWIGPCATSRVVFIQLGHDHSPFRHPSYRTLVHNSILWTAKKLN